MLPNISKIFEKTIVSSLSHYIDEQPLIPEEQFGFKNQHSTIHAINKLTSDINWALNDDKCVGACLIDLEKAFDTVWLEGLLYKLSKTNLPFHLLKIIWKSTQDKRFVTTDGKNTSSITFNIFNGLQQGTVLSPVLFNLFIANLLRLFELNNDNNLKALAFADDLVIYSIDKKETTIENTLQTLFDKIHKYLTNWKLKINTQKCEAILFRPTLKNSHTDVKNHWKKF